MLIQKVYCVIYQFLIQTFRVEDDVGDECRGPYITNESRSQNSEEQIFCILSPDYWLLCLEHPFLLLFFFQD